MNIIKQEKINSALVKEISYVLMNKARDKFLHTITITGALVVADLSYAKIYFTSLTDLPKEQLEKEMNEAADFIRKEIANKIEIRQIPKLKFYYDTSIEYGNNIEKKIREIHEEENN